jgi:hypothetical protein
MGYIRNCKYVCSHAGEGKALLGNIDRFAETFDPFISLSK